MSDKATLDRDLARVMRQVTRATRLAKTIRPESSRTDKMLAASTLSESLKALKAQRDLIADRIKTARQHRGSGQAYADAARLGTKTKK